MKIAYIVSSSFSGSTLLSMVLNAHPQIATISEFDRMDAIAADPDFLCSCGARIRECPYFERVARRMSDLGHVFEVHDMDLTLSLHRNERVNNLLTGALPRVQSSRLERLRDAVVDAIPRYRRRKAWYLDRIDAFMRTVTGLKGASVFLDANKDPFRMRFLDGHYDVRAIYLFKNGIAGAYSYVKNFSAEGRPRSLERASERWFTEQIAIGRVLREMEPAKTLLLSYSDFCTDVRAATARIAEHLGLEDTPLDGFAAAEHHIIGNRMRLDAVEEIRERTDWRDHLSDSDIADYKRVLARYRNRLGQSVPGILEHIWT